MKIVKSSTHKSWIDTYFAKEPEGKDLTFKEARQVAEKDSVEFEQKRKVEASKCPNVATSAETVTPFNPKGSDEDKIVKEAVKTLVNHISDLFGNKRANGKMAGCDVSPEETRITASHRDIKDDSHITEKAHFAFSAKFTLPGTNQYKVAKFIVSYDHKEHDKYKVANVFYDENLNEFGLTTANLESFLKSENNVKKVASEKQLVWFNPENDRIEAVQTTESTTKVAARLRSAGYKVDDNYWVDACHDPRKFGKICVLAKVDIAQASDFKRIAVMSDDEWVNRAGENGKDNDKKMDSKEWVDRTQEKGSYGHKDYKKDDQWVNRTQEKGNDNAYPTEKSILMADASKKDAPVTASKEEPKKPESLLETIENVEKLFK